MAWIETENWTTFDDVFIFWKLITDETYNIFWYVNSLSVCVDYELNEYNLDLSNFNNEEEWIDDIPEVEKILGHYDITSVLKYIRNIYKYNIQEVYYDDYGFIFGNDLSSKKKDRFIIPNKPLSLYSPKEKQDLLALLNKLT